MKLFRIATLVIPIILSSLLVPSMIPRVHAAPPHEFDYVIWIMMENHNLADISSSSAPYQYNLANSWAQSTNFQYESNAGSLPNYIAATSGSTQGITDDGNPSSHPLSGTNIVDRLEGAGLTWKAYMEGMPSTNICNGGGSTDGGTNYIAHHDAFAYYTDITGNPSRCAKVVQAGTSGGASSCTTSMPSGLASTLLGDLGSTSTASNFIWLEPNNYDNTHDCTPSVGSAYLQAIVPSILSSNVFTTQKAVLLITYDEGHDTCCPDPIYTAFVGPQARTSYSNGANTYNHYSLLKTIEDNWALNCLSNDCTSANMDEFLTNPPPPPTSSLFDYIVWIMMENHNLADISSSSAPYQYNLANSWAQSTNFQYESNAGSLYNYIAATSGSMNGINCDGSPNSGCVLPNPGVQNIVDRLAGKSLSWKAYMEGMPTTNVCSYGSAAYSDGSGNNYQAHHDPFVYYSDVYNNSTRCARVIQAGSSSGATSCTTTMPTGLASNLLNDLQSTTTASNLMWLTPNNYDNTHDCTPSVGSAYLQAIVPSILSSNVFTTQKAVLLITYDEGHDTCCPDPIYTVFAGSRAKTNYSSGTTTYDHYSILKTVEINWGLASLTSNDGGASSMAEFLNAVAPDFRVSASPTYVTVAPNAPGTSTVSVNPQYGYTGAISLTVNAPGLSCSLSPTSVSLPPTGTSTLTCSGPSQGIFRATVTGSNSTASRSATVFFSITTAVSLNPRVSCVPAQVKTTDITDNMTGTSSYNNSPFSPGITPPSGYGADNAKRWLTSGATPPNWVSPGPPCSIVNSQGQVIGSFVEIDNVRITSGYSTETDCSSTFNSINGAGTYTTGGTKCDVTANIYSSQTVSCASPTDAGCYSIIHTEFDQDWQGAGYCGPSTVCDPAQAQSQIIAQSTYIDVQGFVFWDPAHLDVSWHSFSGWELHPLTAWRPHTVDFHLSASPNPLPPVPQNNPGNSTITVAGQNGFSGTITLSVSAPGLSCILNPTSVTLSSTTTSRTATLSCQGSTPGTYQATVTGSNSTTSRSTTVSYTITAPGGVSKVTSPNLKSQPITSPWDGSGFYAQGRDWVFYRNQDSCSGATTQCLEYASSSNGASWTTSNIGLVSGNYPSIVTNGTHVFYVRYNGTDSQSGKAIMFRIGILRTDGTISWNPETMVKVGTTGTYYYELSMRVSTTGQVFVAYHNASSSFGGGIPLVVHSNGLDYSTWQQQTVLTSSRDDWRFSLVSLPNGQIYILYWPFWGALRGRLWSGGSWGPEEIVTPSNTFVQQVAFGFSTGNSTVYAVWQDRASENIQFDSRISSWGSPQTIARSDTGSNPKWTASYDSLQGKWYVIYYNTTLSQIYQYSGTPGSWSGKTQLWTATANSTMLIGSYYNSGLVNPSSRVIGVFWTQNDASNKLELMFANETITGAAPSVPLLRGWAGVAIGESDPDPVNPASSVFPGQAASDMELEIANLTAKGLNAERVIFADPNTAPASIVNSTLGQSFYFTSTRLSRTVTIAQHFGIWLILNAHNYCDWVNASYSCTEPEMSYTITNAEPKSLSFWQYNVTGPYLNVYSGLIYEPVNEPLVVGSVKCGPTCPNNNNLTLTYGSSGGNPIYIQRFYQDFINTIRNSVGDTSHYLVVENAEYDGDFPIVTDMANRTLLNRHWYYMYAYQSPTYSEFDYNGAGGAYEITQVNCSWSVTCAQAFADKATNYEKAAEARFHMVMINTEIGADLGPTVPPDSQATGSCSYSTSSLAFVQRMINNLTPNKIGFTLWTNAAWTELGTYGCLNNWGRQLTYPPPPMQTYLRTGPLPSPQEILGLQTPELYIASASLILALMPLLGIPARRKLEHASRSSMLKLHESRNRESPGKPGGIQKSRTNCPLHPIFSGSKPF